MDIDPNLVMDGFLTNMETFLTLMAYAGVAGIILGGFFIWWEHYR